MTNAERYALRYPADTRTTDEVWSAAHEALSEQRWGEARQELDNLAQRSDVADCLRSAASYGLTGPYAALIQDRIDLVNSIAERAR